MSDSLEERSRQASVPSAPSSAASAVSFVSFCLTAPLLLPLLDSITTAAWPLVGTLEGFPPEAVAFANPLVLAALFVALAVLFASLVGGRPLRLGRRVELAAAGLYTLGYCAVAACTLLPAPVPLVALSASGGVLGAGGALLALHWISVVAPDGFKEAFRAVLAAAALTLASSAMARVVPSHLVFPAYAALATVSALAFVRSRRAQEPTEQPSAEGGDWWAVFGGLDVSFLDEAEDIQTPRARGLFFIVAPLVMIALFAADRLLLARMPFLLSPVVIGGIIALLCALLLLRVKRDRMLLNFSFRFFVPLVAFASFAAAAFVPESVERLVLMVGGFAFLTAYALSMTAMLLTMSGRMRSLSVPVAGLLVVVACLIDQIAFVRFPFAEATDVNYLLFLSLFVAAAVLLIITPGSRLWHVLLDGIDERSDAAVAHRSYLDRCEAVAAAFELTPREAEVLVLLGRGHTSAFVAERLVISESTARSHRKNIYRKLEVGSREQLFELLDRFDQSE